MTHKISKSTLLSSLLEPSKIFKSMDDAGYHALIRSLIAAQLHAYFSYKLDFTEAELPLLVRRHLQSANTFAKAQDTQARLACKTIAADLASLKAPIVLLKGAAYIAANKENAKGRLISDIDILVTKEQLPTIEKLLSGQGWQAKELDDYDEKYYRQWSHELPPYTHAASGVNLDIHHNLLPGSAGKSIDVNNILHTSINTETGLFVPQDKYLILHSAIHLLLNDDVEKGLRDCLDLHTLLNDFTKQNELKELHTLFTSAKCEDEFIILLVLLKQLFGSQTTRYTNYLEQCSLAKKHAIKAKDFANAVFPNSQYIEDSNNSISRFKVYMNGHLSKMPPFIFLKHIIYKAYRVGAKKLFGEFIFKKPHKEQ